MMDGQPPTDDELLECAVQALVSSDLDRITTKDVYIYYSDFDHENKKEFIKTAVNTIINTGPTTAQAQYLVNDLKTSQKWEAVANDLNMLQEAANKVPESRLWDFICSFTKVVTYLCPRAETSSHNRTQQSRLEEEEKETPDDQPKTSHNTTQQPRPEEEETPDDRPKTPEQQDASQPTDASADDVDAETTVVIMQTEEVGCSSKYCKIRKSTAAGGKIPKRRRRQMIRTTPAKFGPLTILQRMIRLEERHLSLTRDNAIALNHVADSVDRLADFITECSQRIAGDIEQRNTPN